VVGGVLFLYLTTTEGAVSDALISEENEIHYPSIKKLAFTLVIASRKLRPYFHAYSIRVLTKEPLKKMLGYFDALG
jgi:hypothetical protein